MKCHNYATVLPAVTRNITLHASDWSQKVSRKTHEHTFISKECKEPMLEI